MTDILSTIHKKMGSFSKGQKRIAQYILDDYDKAAFQTASVLGKTVQVSESTVVRFASLLGYDGFTRYGLRIVMAFDEREALFGQEISDCPVRPASEIVSQCRQLDASIGIITVPAAQAQAVCYRLVEGGIEAIWNFAPVRLIVPDDILVQNENMASSLAVLSQHLIDRRRT